MSFAPSAVLARPSVRRVAIAVTAAAAVATSAAACSAPSNPQTIAKNQMYFYGWGSSAQWNCLNNLWQRESGWNPYASNPYSGAYGIPQALPGSKMGAAGADWATNPSTQIRWGLNYIRGSYGSPCGAWSHSLATGWY